jgi:hypothetical protein
MHDSIRDVDHESHGPDLTRTDDDIGAGPDASGIGSVVHECPWEAGVVHRVEIDD